MRRLARLTRFARVALLVPAALVGAQEPQGAPSSSQLRVDATMLRPARYAYDLVLTRDGMTQPLGTQTVSFSEATYAGTPSWLILETRSGAGISGLDSLVVTRDGLVPLHWGATTGLARLAAEFTRDSLYGATSSPLGKRTLVGPAPRGAIASEGMLDGLMHLAPIDKGWTSGATLVVADVAGTRLVAARLMAEREEDVTVPAGTFPTWVVSVRTGNGEKWLWVSKDHRMVVKSSQALAQLEGAVLERVLTRVDDLTLIPPPAVPLPTDPRSAPGRATASP
jgi:hypothetical protein